MNSRPIWTAFWTGSGERRSHEAERSPPLFIRAHKLSMPARRQRTAAITPGGCIMRILAGLAAVSALAFAGAAFAQPGNVVLKDGAWVTTDGMPLYTFSR